METLFDFEVEPYSEAQVLNAFEVFKKEFKDKGNYYILFLYFFIFT